MSATVKCPDCGKKISEVNSCCTGCGRFVAVPEKAPAGAASPVFANNSLQGSPRTLLAICLGTVLFVFFVPEVFRRQARPVPADTASAQAGGPAGQAAGSRRAARDAPPVTPAAPDGVPLKRSLAEIERRYGRNMRLEGETLTGAGYAVKSYRVGTGADELTLREGRLFKRSMAFNIAEIEGAVGSFCAAVYIHALHPTAYDINYSADALTGEVRSKAELFGSRCAALRAAGGREARHYEADGAYVFSCVNSNNTRLRFEVSSQEYFRADNTGGRAR
jgi:hypothetical protein